MTECRLSRVSHGTTNESNWAFQFTKSSWWAWKTRLLRMAALVALSPKSRKSGFATRTCVCVCERQRVHRAHARIHCEALAQLILIGRHWRSQHIRNGRNWLRGIARATRCHGKFKESRSCLSFGFSLGFECVCVCVCADDGTIRWTEWAPKRSDARCVCQNVDSRSSNERFLNPASSICSMHSVLCCYWCCRYFFFLISSVKRFSFHSVFRFCRDATTRTHNVALIGREKS